MKDDTHFNSYGAYELARSVVESLRTQKLPLALELRRELARLIRRILMRRCFSFR